MLFLDLQTTGASPGTGAPLEIAWTLGCALEQQHSAVTKHLLKQPGDALIPKRIQSITGISDQDMAQAVAWDDVEVQLFHGVIDNAGGVDQRQFLPGDGRSVFAGLEWKF